jgi:hypothetical protein
MLSKLLAGFMAMASMNSSHVAPEKRIVTDAKLGPLLIMPSLIGNRLFGSFNSSFPRHAWYCESENEWPSQLFLSKEVLIPEVASCILSRLIMEARESGGNYTYVEPHGVSIPHPLQVPSDVTPLDAVAYLDGPPFARIPIWASIIKNLTDAGLVPGDSLRAVLYDWRSYPGSWEKYYYPTLVSTIEEMAGKHGPVTLCSLSQGGPATAHFLSTRSAEWQRKYVRQWMSFSGVFGGSTEAITAILLPNKGDDYSVFPPEEMLNVLRTWPSAYYLFPRTAYFGTSAPFVSTPTRNYTAADFADLLADAKIPNHSAYEPTLPPTEAIAAPAIPLHCSIGTQVKTILGVALDATFSNYTDAWFDANGDGVVPHAALYDPCIQWNASTILEFPHMTHAGEVRNFAAQTYLLKILQV